MLCVQCAVCARPCRLGSIAIRNLLIDWLDVCYVLSPMRTSNEGMSIVLCVLCAYKALACCFWLHVLSPLRTCDKGMSDENTSKVLPSNTHAHAY